MSSEEDGPAPPKRHRVEPLHLTLEPLGRNGYEFVDSEFDIMVFLRDENDQLKSGGEDVPLAVSLRFADHPHDQPQPRDARPPLLVVEPANPVVHNGRAELRCRVTDVSMHFENRPFCLHATPLHAKDRDIIADANSNAVHIIRHRLKLTHPPNWESQWYKDEGGRDKCISFDLELVDRDDRLVTDRPVPLKATLLYARNMLEVFSQDILKISPECSLALHEGKATLRLRIEDVSKNHQNQAFSIAVGVNTARAPLGQDISSVVCEPIVVKSKQSRAKRKREAERLALAAEGGTSAVAHDGDVAEAPATGESVPGHDGPVNTTTMSLQAVLSWIQDVLDTLTALRWQKLGFHMDPTGLPDRERPLFNIPNPNEQADRLIQEYTNKVMQSLQYILYMLSQIDAQNAASSADTASSVAGADQPKAALLTLSAVANASSGDGATSSGFPGGLALPDDLPSLLRQTSSTIIGPGAVGGEIPTQFQTAAVGSLDGDIGEASVWFLVGKVFSLKKVLIGFPAFDQFKRLVGCYREDEAGGDALIFYPLAVLRMTDKDSQAAAEALDKEIGKNSPCVFSLGDHGNQLQETKHAMLSYVYQKRVGAADGFDMEDIVDIQADLEDALTGLSEFTQQPAAAAAAADAATASSPALFAGTAPSQSATSAGQVSHV